MCKAKSKKRWCKQVHVLVPNIYQFINEVLTKKVKYLVFNIDFMFIRKYKIVNQNISLVLIIRVLYLSKENWQSFDWFIKLIIDESGKAKREQKKSTPKDLIHKVYKKKDNRNGSFVLVPIGTVTLLSFYSLKSSIINMSSNSWE